MHCTIAVHRHTEAPANKYAECRRKLSGTLAKENKRPYDCMKSYNLDKAFAAIETFSNIHIHAKFMAKKASEMKKSQGKNVRFILQFVIFSLEIRIN